MFWLVLSVLVGAVVWLTLSGRLTPLLRRAAGWWLDVGANQPASAPPHPASDPVEDEDDSPGLLQRFTARLRARFSRYDDIDDGMVADTRPAPAAHIPPAAPLSAPAPVLPATPRVAERVSAVPVIELRDVADNLQQRHYRQSRGQPCASTPAEPAAELPLLDGKAIRDNMLGRVRHVPAKPAEPTLPVIGPNEVEQNLQQLGSRLRERAPSLPSHDEPLPVIDAGAVRESLRQIHGARFRPRLETPRVQEPEPRPAPPRFVSPPAVPAPAPQPQPSSPLLRRREEGDAPARFVDLPTAVAHRADGVPVESARAPEPPVPAPRSVVTPVQVMPTIVRPAVRIAQVSAEPVLPPVAQAESTVEPLPEDEPAPAAPSAPQPAVAEPAGLAGTVVPAPRAPTAAGIVWHSIEERAPAVAPPVPAPVPVVADEDARPVSLVVEVPPSSAMSTPVPSRHLWDDSSLPSLALLRPADPLREVCSEEALLERGIVIEEKLAEFKVKVSVVDAYAGPVITRFEIEPAVGVRGSQVVNLVKDLARALGLASIRVVETIPGKTCMGLELPNPVRQMIRLSEILSAPVFTDSGARLTLALGKDITGEPVVMDLTKAPHLLVAGTTGSGKSVGVNAMILSLLYRFTPDKVRFIMIDPKMLELSVYNDIPHLLAPVVTDMKLAANALNWCVGEMEKRYRLMSALGVRNLAGYNEKVREAEVAGEKLTNPFTVTPDNPEPLETLPSIVVVVDEFADLMMVAGKKIEELIARLAQKARAAGIHLILATQRPSVDVITGLIKANIPTRIAFQVSSKVDSRTILDQMGAEALLGQGDMLFLPPGSGYPQRIHGAFVTDDEVHAIVETLKSFGEPDYIDGLLTGEAELEESAATERSAGAESDPLYDEAVEIVLRTRKASISSVQRHLRIGYNRAARLIEEMEAAGLVSSMENNGNRTVLVPPRAE